MSHGGRMQEMEEELWHLNHPNGPEPNVSSELAEKRRLERERVWAEAEKA